MSSSGLPPSLKLRRALDAAQEAGDPLYGAFIRTHLVTHLFASGDPLDEVQKEAEAGSARAAAKTAEKRQESEQR